MEEQVLKDLYSKAQMELKNPDLLDDGYARIFFRDNIRDTQTVLRTIMGKPELIVKSVTIQQKFSADDDLRGAIFDVYAVDSDGTQYDIEVQKESGGATPYRASFNSAIMTVNSLMKTEQHSELAKRQNVVIFITLHDVLKGKLPLYTIKRTCLETGREFHDGTSIIYVNTAHKDYTTAIGKLIHDFRCKKPEEMYSQEFAETAGRIYVSKGGKIMKSLDAIRDYCLACGREEGIAEGEAKGEAKAANSIALALIRLGQNALEDIAKVCNLSLQQVQELAATIQR